MNINILITKKGVQILSISAFLLALIVAAPLYVGTKVIANDVITKVNCSQFKSASNGFYLAQEAYKNGATWLDRGGEKGIACESIKNTNK